MSNKVKNIITNILGLVFWGLSIYEYFTDRNMYFIIGLVIIGGVGFLLNISESRGFLKKYLNKKTS